MMVSVPANTTKGSDITNMIDGVFIEKVRGDDFFNNLF